jgi:hypothetical protein
VTFNYIALARHLRDKPFSSLFSFFIVHSTSSLLWSLATTSTMFHPHSPPPAAAAALLPVPANVDDARNASGAGVKVSRGPGHPSKQQIKETYRPAALEAIARAVSLHSPFTAPNTSEKGKRWAIVLAEVYRVNKQLTETLQSVKKHIAELVLWHKVSFFFS